jgi:hypothetical protein
VQLVLHIGAHGTDEGLIARWLAGNATVLGAEGVCAPPPRRFLQALTQTLDRQRDTDPLAREEALLRSLGASGARRWMAVSAPGLLGPVADVIAPEGFYKRDVARRLLGLRTLFPRCRMTVLLAVRAPSGLLPAILPDDPHAIDSLMPLIDGETLPWARLVAALQRHVPQARVVVWRHEDLPRVWPDILSEIVGPGRALPPAGLFEFAAQGLSAQAQLRLRRYLATTRPGTAGQLRQVAHVFARRFGAAVEPDASRPLPEWVWHEATRLDRGYRTEWDDIAGLPGVRVLDPGGAVSG